MDKKKWLMIFIIGIGTAVLGELKIQPFGSSFRFGLGSLFFILSIAYLHRLPLRTTGLVVGIVTVFLRGLLDVNKGQLFWDGLIAHYPAAFYYIVFSFFLYNIRWWERREFPIQMGVIMTLGDIIANLIELIIRGGIGAVLIPERIWLLTVVALIRGLVVIILTNTLLHERFQATKEVEEEQLVERILVGSNLHMEAFYLRKSMAQIETVMVRSHDLYKKLKSELPGPNPLASVALDVAKEVHEVKKDLRRMVEGLNRIVTHAPTVEIMDIKEILDLVASANRSMAEVDDKNINIKVFVEGQYVTDCIYPLVSILNNLVQNSVEAIANEGQIEVNARVHKNKLTVEIIDNGPGIAVEDRDMIFEPGFTTKFNPEGEPSTGIGLAHVRDMVEHLGGKIEVRSTQGKGSIFGLELPREWRRK